MDTLEFEDGQRTFSCRRGSSPATGETLWWWLTITAESHRFAAFRAEATDTAANLRPRVEAYYAKVLADRARPREFRPRTWGRPAAAPPTTEQA